MNMTTEDEISALVKRYMNDRRLDFIESLYMWSREIPSPEIAEAVRARYGSGSAYGSMVEDLRNLKLKKPSQETRDTKVRLYKVIQHVVHDQCFPALVDRSKENLKSLSPRARRFLWVLIRIGALKGGNRTPRDTIWSPYEIVFMERLTEFEKGQVIIELSKAGIIEYLQAEELMMSAFVDLLAPQLETFVKLPKITVEDQVTD